MKEIGIDVRKLNGDTSVLIIGEEGTLNWAFKIAEKEGEVWHKLNEFACDEKYNLNEYRDDLVRKSWSGEIISIKQCATLKGMLTGWYSKNV